MTYEYCPIAAAEYERRKAAHPEIYYELERIGNEELAIYRQGLFKGDELYTYDLLRYWKSKQCTAARAQQAAMATMEQDMDAEDRAELEQLRAQDKEESRARFIERVKWLARVEVKEAARKSTNRATFKERLRKAGKPTAELVEKVVGESDLMNRLFLDECGLRGW
jgi:hypothetical protein